MGKSEDFTYSYNINGIRELRQILEIDSKVYPLQYQSSFEQVVKRFERNRECFTVVRNLKHEIVGYVCYFPITENLEKTILSGEMSNDAELSETEILPHDAVFSAIYIISIAIDPKYQNTSAIKVLMKGFSRHLGLLKNNGSFFDKVIAIAISEKGEQTLLKSGFLRFKKINNISSVYVLNNI